MNGRTGSSPFTVACALTHRRAWERIVTDGLDYGIIYEADAVFKGSRKQYLRHVLHVMTTTDPKWELINLGRCFDFCESQKFITKLSPTQNIVTSLSSGCTHAYMISREGAKKLLQWSLPYTMPVDYLMDMLSRSEILRMYSITAPVFHQVKTDDAHDHDAVVECDPAEKWLLKKYKTIAEDDKNVLAKISASWVSQWVRDTLEAQDGVSGGVKNVVKDAHCVELDQFCEWISGSNVEGPEEAQFNKHLDDLGFQTVVIWGLTINEGHTHRYIHGALKDAAVRAFRTSMTPRRICWVPSSTILCHEDPVQNSLVFATPKHMTYTMDPPLKHCPVSSTNRYIFHELIPPQFYDIRTNVVQWVVRGPDGSSPVLEAEHYALRKSVPCPDVACFYNTTYVAPWATRYRPDPDAKPPPGTRRRSSVVHFIGTIWWLNVQEFCSFVSGCNAVGVKVVRHGVSQVPPGACEGINATWDDDWRSVPDDERTRFMWESAFVPTFQGAAHLNGNESYISDRTIDAIALGMKVVTNNKFAADLFNVPYADPYDMCALNKRTPIPYANPMMAAKHTYLSRLNDILGIFNSPPT